jgi:hypothetical protein
LSQRATPNGSTVALLTFPNHGVVTEGVDPVGRKIAEAFTRPPSEN